MIQRLRIKAESDIKLIKLLHFDVKSNIFQYARKQFYNIIIQQQRHVVFYIGICAANSFFVEFISNFQ